MAMRGKFSVAPVKNIWDYAQYISQRLQAVDGNDLRD